MVMVSDNRWKQITRRIYDRLPDHHRENSSHAPSIASVKTQINYISRQPRELEIYNKH